MADSANLPAMSHFHPWIDGSIVGLYLLGTMVAGIWVRRYVSKVEHFLVAGREMNLYLGIASLAAKDAATGQRVYTRTSFFFVCRWLIPGMWGIAALAMLGPVQEGGSTLMAMPTFLATFLPIGLMGLMVAAMLAADMSTNSSYMLGWGSVIYNDILAPFRKRRWPEARAIRWNRCIVALIGVYLFVFGLLYEIQGDVWSYLLLSGSVYLSSMSVLLIACCYWKKANSWGAAGAILGGALVPIGFLTLEKMNANAELAARIGKDNAGIAAFAAAVTGMVVGSLIKPKFSSAIPETA